MAPRHISHALKVARVSHEAYLQQRRKAALAAVLAACAGASFYLEVAYSRKPYHTSILTGRMWLTKFLGGNPRCIKDQLGMRKHVFKQLVWQLYLKTSVTHTHHMDLEEQVAIFLYIIVTNLSNRKVAEHFQRSGDTISK
jgi:hypothetical protein